jgi:hypothetical protein
MCRQLHPNNPWFKFYALPLCVGIAAAMPYAFDLVEHWKSIQPFKAEYGKISQKVEKILKDIEELG